MEDRLKTIESLTKEKSRLFELEIELRRKRDETAAKATIEIRKQIMDLDMKQLEIEHKILVLKSN